MRPASENSLYVRDILPPQFHRQTAAQDIYSTGQLLLSIVTSERTYAEIPPELPSSAKDFFAR